MRRNRNELNRNSIRTPQDSHIQHVKERSLYTGCGFDRGNLTKDYISGYSIPESVYIDTEKLNEKIEEIKQNEP